MLAFHADEVQEYLLEKKEAYVDPGDETSVDENIQQPLRSPPLPAGLRSPGSVPPTKNGHGNGRMPPIALFPVSNTRTGTLSPTGPGSPLRQGFGRG